MVSTMEIESKVFTEVRKGFDSADERREVFLDIADEYNVSPDKVWAAFFKLTTLFNPGVIDDMTEVRRCIYIDMDGVVADFNKFSSDLLGRQVGWGEQDLTDEEWEVLASIDNIYAKIPLIKESTRLVAMAKSFQTRFYVEFLTAIPRRTTIPTAEQDKKDWLSKYYPGIRMNIGPYSADKQKWCKPGDILIDDKPSNIEQWYKAGGIAIYHQADFDITIKHLFYAVDKFKAVILT